MDRVTGIGGIFFKAHDPEKLKVWYRQHLGIEPGDDGTVVFQWREQHRPDLVGTTVWAPFPHDTRYFDPSSKPFMINYRVANLGWLLEQLRAEGVQVEDQIEEHEYGRFAWVIDPEGNRVELWEPAEGQ
jgi:predicted enzyme related to lactoylglutathione lyase